MHHQRRRPRYGDFFGPPEALAEEYALNPSSWDFLYDDFFPSG